MSLHIERYESKSKTWEEIFELKPGENPTIICGLDNQNRVHAYIFYCPWDDQGAVVQHSLVPVFIYETDGEINIPQKLLEAFMQETQYIESHTNIVLELLPELNEHSEKIRAVHTSSLK